MINPAELLIERFCDMGVLEQDIRRWSMDTFHKDEPRKVRLAMIDGLFRALDIHCNYVQFANGESIREVYSLDRLLDNMVSSGIPKAQWLVPASEALLRETWTLGATRLTFRTLLTDRMALEVHRRRDRNSLAMSMTTILPSVIVGTNNIRLAEVSAPINHVLASMINPNELTMPMETLIEKYAYPDVNLGALDLEWF